MPVGFVLIIVFAIVLDQGDSSKTKGENEQEDDTQEWRVRTLVFGLEQA